MPSADLAPAPPSRPLRTRVGLAFVQVLRPALYVLLVASALLAFFAGQRGGPPMPGWVANLAPAFFAVFLVVFAIYRLSLVRARRYPAATGLFQIGLGALVLVLLLPHTKERFAEGAEGAVADGQDDLPELMHSRDPRVRALAAEVAALRSEPRAYAAGLLDLLGDEDAQVRARARASLVQLNGGIDPAAGATGDQARAAFRTALQARGWIKE